MEKQPSWKDTVSLFCEDLLRFVCVRHVRRVYNESFIAVVCLASTNRVVDPGIVRTCYSLPFSFPFH